MAYAGSQHQTANDIQKLLITSIEDPKTEGKDKAQLARAWEALERLKREMRGIAPLKAADAIRCLKPAQRILDATPLEIASEPSNDKESLKHSQEPTVTAPPTPDAHIDEG